MKTTEKTQMINSEFDNLLASKNVEQISEMIKIKRKAMIEAQDNASYFLSIDMLEHANSEIARADLLMRQLKQLHSAIF